MHAGNTSEDLVLPRSEVVGRPEQQINCTSGIFSYRLNIGPGRGGSSYGQFEQPPRAAFSSENTAFNIYLFVPQIRMVKAPYQETSFYREIFSVWLGLGKCYLFNLPYTRTYVIKLTYVMLRVAIISLC